MIVEELIVWLSNFLKKKEIRTYFSMSLFIFNFSNYYEIKYILK